MNKLFMFSMNSAVILMLFILPAIQQPSAMLVAASGLNDTQDSGGTIVVTSAADSGPGTLRQALLEVQNGDTIAFDPNIFPPDKPATIYLQAEDNDSSLPNITQGGITIDASNAGVILDGSGIQGDWVNGLEIYSDGNTVKGLQIINFSGSGIAMCSASNNMIGGDRGTGTGPLGQGNLVSKNGIGIDLCDAGSFNTVSGNIVGTNPNGDEDMGNIQSGILIENGMTHNVIGLNNIIAHNDRNGVYITGSNAFGNVITQNSIHDNGSLGIRLENGGNTEISPPQISDFDLVLGTVMGTACANCTIEIYSDSGSEGQFYEGQTKAETTGTFTLNKGISFTGPYLTATATDTNGNTSEFSWPTYTFLQEGNDLPKIRLQPKRSHELAHNYIGRHWHGLAVAPDLDWMLTDTLEMGMKRFRLSINSIDSDKIVWDLSENSVNPIYDEFIWRLADNGITMTYVLSFWDKEYVASGGEIYSPRFKTEEEIQRYLEFVRFVVRHFRDRIQYYEIWNEPDISHMELQLIEVADYIYLVKRAVAVIRQEYPEAKVVVGSVPLRYSGSRDYLFSVLNSDIMPMVDAVAWHATPGESPKYEDLRDYYYDYSSILLDIKNTASANGFKGEYIADELAWMIGGHPDHPYTFSEAEAAKYYLRGIVSNLGMGVRVTQHSIDPGDPMIHTSVQNLCTVMAGNEPASLPIQIQSTVTNTVSYTFSLPNSAQLIALYTDGIAVDDDPGVPATLTIPGFTGYEVTGIDVSHGFQQQLITSDEDGNLVIHGLLVKDYPIILRLYQPKYLFFPGIMKGSVDQEGTK
jgi:parallel beta-helix repeat protein